MPIRIQRKRSKGWSVPPNTVYVGRPGKWGNNFDWLAYGRAEAVRMFHEYIGHPNSPHGFQVEEIETLRGKNLSCWCPLDQPCHADVLLELANSDPEPLTRNQDLHPSISTACLIPS